MTTAALILTVLLAVPIGVVAVNFFLAPRLHRVPGRRKGSRVSVLVPARNEAENLRRLLPAVLRSDYRPMEVLVLNDVSTDRTEAVARSFAARDSRVRVFTGTEPPSGWTGKNWACHQLAREADGEILLFCDADVRPGTGAVARSVTALSRSGAQVLTAIPRHDRSGWFAEAVVPLVATVPIVSLLALPLVPWRRFPSLSVGNGQWFVWRREAYERLGGHARVRSDVLEDVRLARLAKTEGFRLIAYVASRDITVRMYRNQAAAWEGFGKNLYLLVGGRPWTLALALSALVVGGLGPLIVPFLPGATALDLVPLAMLVLLRGLAAAITGAPAAGLLLHPVGVAAAMALTVSSWRRHRKGAVAWKGRTLTHEEAA